jgi:hypothetical protein
MGEGTVEKGKLRCDARVGGVVAGGESAQGSEAETRAGYQYAQQGDADDGGAVSGLG